MSVHHYKNYKSTYKKMSAAQKRGVYRWTTRSYQYNKHSGCGSRCQVTRVATGQTVLNRSGFKTTYGAYIIVYGLNVVKTKLWSYSQHLTYSTDYPGGNIFADPIVSYVQKPATIKVHVFGFGKALGWESMGRQDETVFDASGGSRTHYRSFSQGGFKFCPPRIVCFESVYPETTIDVYSSGRAKFHYSLN